MASPRLSAPFVSRFHGIGRIGTDGNTLYIVDRFSNVYAFQEKQQLSFVEKGARDLPREVFTLGKEGYYLKNWIVFHQSTIIVDLWASSVGGRILHTIYRILALAVIALIFPPKRKEPEKQPPSPLLK